MTDYKTMYFKLAAEMTNAIESLEKVINEMKNAMLELEENFVDEEG